MKFDRIDKVLRATVLLLALSAPSDGFDKLTIEITGGAGSGLPIDVVPFK